MSEKQIIQPEQHEGGSEVVDKKHHEKVNEHLAEQAERARQEKSAENIAKIRELAKAEAEAASKTKPEEVSSGEDDSGVGMQHSLKHTAYARTLARVQQKLPRAARSFSKLVHNPAVDKLSAVGAQTVARPSGILGGSIVAFLGSLTVLYISKHYGYSYNYLLLFILFVGGFIVGAIFELVVWLLYSRKQHY